MSVSNYLNQSH